MYTAEQIEKGLWDSYRRDQIEYIESLSPEDYSRWKWYSRSEENLHKEYEDLDFWTKREGHHWSDVTDNISGGAIDIDGELVRFDVVSNDDDEFMYLVKAVIRIGDQYFVKEGRHISHDGTYWDGDFYETVPKEKVVTQWDRK